jgi:hypothetical protein
MRTGPVRTLCWFGNAGAPYARFGLTDLADIREPLLEVASRHRIRLIVVSNSHAAFVRIVVPLGLECEYRQWAEGVTEAALSESEIALIPNSMDSFSRCKSANRALFALAHGVPVVATATAALEPLAGCIETGWVSGIERYLSDPAAVSAHLTEAKAIIAREFSGAAIAEVWRTLLSEVGSVREGPGDGEPLSASAKVDDMAVGPLPPALQMRCCTEAGGR